MDKNARNNNGGKTMMICLKCGNQERFERTAYVKTWGTQTEILNGDEDIISDYDYETDDSETYDSDEPTCCECESRNIEVGHDEEGIRRIIWKHTDQKGKWHEKELPKKDRNKKIGAELMIEKL